MSDEQLSRGPPASPEGAARPVGCGVHHAVGAPDAPLNGSPSPDQMHQSLAFAAEVVLHSGDGDNGHIAHESSADALEGLG